MTIFPERDTGLHLCRLMVADDLKTRYPYDLTTDTFLVRDFEVADRLVFTSGIALHPFEFFRFLDHFFGDKSELSSLVCEYICLIFVGLDFFIKARIGSVLRFDTSLDLFECIIIVSYELLDLFAPDIEIEDPISKRIEKFCIMRDHEYCSLVFLEK